MLQLYQIPPEDEGPGIGLALRIGFSQLYLFFIFALSELEWPARVA